MFEVAIMEYQIKTTGKRVILNVLANADKSMVGLRVADSNIISMRYSEFRALVVAVLGVQEINNFDLTLFKYHTLPVQQKDGETDETIIVMETVEGSHTAIFEPEHILNALKLYQASDIFSCYLFSYRVMEGHIQGGGIGKVLLHEHAIHWPNKPYQMTDESQTAFCTWFESHKTIHGANQNEKFKQMLRLYLDSYLLGDANQSFVMLTIVLEMLFGSMVELTYRISRGTGFFLSNNRDEMRRIVRSVKQLYNLRSKYVHEGKTIAWESLFELREIVRKTIILMYEKGMHETGFNFKTFSDEVTYDGYLRE